MPSRALAAGLFLGSFLLTFGYLELRGAPATPEPASAARPAIASPSQSATLLFMGDVMLDRTIRSALVRGGPNAVFGSVAPLLASADFVAGNLEGPITDNASKSLGTTPGQDHNTTFTFDPSVAGILASYGFKLVSIGNNHIADFGAGGVASTKRYLTDAHVAYVGDPFATSSAPVIENVKGLKIGFAAYDAFINPDPAQTEAEIASARAAGADFVVVMAHWGAEYDPAPPDSVRVLAHAFVQSGADLVIGTHSHVIGQEEAVGSARIYYSLGNFIFDQYFDASVRCGLTVAVTLAKSAGATAASYIEKPVELTPSGATVPGCS